MGGVRFEFHSLSVYARLPRKMLRWQGDGEKNLINGDYSRLTLVKNQSILQPLNFPDKQKTQKCEFLLGLFLQLTSSNSRKRLPQVNLKDIQDRLQQYKEVNNLTYDELGTLIGTTKAVAYDIIKNRRRFIDLTILAKIMKLIEG